jgi:phosphoglucosamine mutase
MSNGGLESLLKSEGMEMVRAGVGDRQVLAEMERTGAVLGAEQSGHVILGDRATTGDGLAAALEILAIAARRGLSLSALRKGWTRWPQVKRNFRMDRRLSWEGGPVEEALGKGGELLAGEGRILLRYSGTEPVLRLLVEGRCEETTNRVADLLSTAIATHLAGRQEP